MTEARHSSPSADVDDRSIPVLTERIFPPSGTARAEAQPREAPSAQPAAADRDDGEVASRPAIDAAAGEAAVAVPPHEDAADAATEATSSLHGTGENSVTIADHGASEAAAENSAAADAEAESATRTEALREDVLRRVGERLDQQLNATVRELMPPAIDQAMARVAEEAQSALRLSLRDLVEDVLREELSRHRDQVRD